MSDTPADATVLERADTSRFDTARKIFVQSISDEAHVRPDDLPVVHAAVERSRQVIEDVGVFRSSTRVPTIDDPIVVIGLLRTGTTLLHNILDLHPRVHGPALWELMDPVSAGDDPARAAMSIAAGRRYVTEYNAKSPDFAVIHPLHADRPDECQRLLANTFHSMVLEMRYNVPRYGEWLHDQDHAAAYRAHRDQLEVLMRSRVAADDSPLTPVLKCPFHTWYLPALVAAYPRARFVHLHRNPVDAISSTASLCRAVRSARTDQVDLSDIGDLWRRRIVPLTDSLADSRDDLIEGRPVQDIRYDELVADPVGIAARVCRALGLEVTDQYRSAVATYLDEHRPAKTGRHVYSPDEFGLDAGALDRDTASYRSRFLN